LLLYTISENLAYIDVDSKIRNETFNLLPIFLSWVTLKQVLGKRVR